MTAAALVRHRAALAIIASAVVAAAAPAQDGAPGDTTAAAALQQRLAELDQKVRILQRLRELDAEAAAARAREAPTLAAGREGFLLRSADRAFQLAVRGYLQTDSRLLLHDRTPAASSSVLLRRVRPVVEATVWRYFDFRVMPDFADGRAVLYDGYTDARVAPWLALRAGKFKPPLGLERLQSATDLLFVERGMPTNLVPNRDVGLQLHGAVRDGRLAYAVGGFDGVTDLGMGDAATDDGKDVEGRIFLQPLHGLGVGVAGSSGTHRGATGATLLPGYRAPSQQTVFAYRADGTAAGTTVADGRHARLVPQGYFYSGSFGLLSEYAQSVQHVRRGAEVARLSHRAWQAAGSWVLTGERAGYRGVTPRRPFDPAAHSWGALELGLRFGELRPDHAAFPRFADPSAQAARARERAVALNWYLARGVRLLLDYEQTRFRGGAPNGADRPHEHAMLVRMQEGF